MLKKLLVLVTVVSVILASSLSCISVFANLDTYDYIHGGTMVVEGSYTAAADGSVKVGWVSGTSSSTSGYRDRWTRFMEIAGTTVSNINKASTICTLTENEEYFFTIVYRHSIVETESSSDYSVYINGVKVANTDDYNHHKSHYIDDVYSTGINTLAYVSDDVAANYDMTSYSALLSTENADIILGGKDVKGDSIFGGFTANVYSDMTAGEFAQNVTASEGATLSITRSGEALLADASLQSGDVAVVTSQNGKVINEYDIKLAKLAVFSDVYSVSNTNVISGVYEFTPVNTFMNYLSIADGYTAVLKNGEDEVTSGVVSEAMTLEAASAEGDVQVYTIDIADRQTRTTVSSSAAVTFVDSIPNIDDFRGNFVIELDTTVAHGYYTGPDGNSALYVAVADEVVSLGMYKNAWSGTQPTDLTDGEELSIILVIRPIANGQNNIDYYINGNYTGTCSMNSIKSGIWTNWRVHANTSASFFKVEDEMEYLRSKGVYKINADEDGNVCAEFVTRGTKALYLAVYDGNKLDSVQIAPYNDYNFKNNTVTIPEGSEGKTVKAFLWGSKLNPLSHLTIQE